MKMVWFPDWRAVLESSGLPGREVRSHGVVIRWYPGWLKRRHEPATVATARAFVAWAEEQKQLAEWMVRSWRAGLQWFSFMRRSVVRWWSVGTRRRG